MKKIFTENKTFYGFQNKEINNDVLKELYDYVKNNATSFNCQPLRISFIKSKEAKERLKPFILETNLEKTMSAPVTAILAMDLSFYEDLPKNWKSNFLCNLGYGDENQTRPRAPRYDFDEIIEII